MLQSVIGHSCVGIATKCKSIKNHFILENDDNNFKKRYSCVIVSESTSFAKSGYVTKSM